MSTSSVPLGQVKKVPRYPVLLRKKALFEQKLLAVVYSALKKARELGRGEVQDTCLFEIAKCLIVFGKFEQAEKHLRKCVEILHSALKLMGESQQEKQKEEMGGGVGVGGGGTGGASNGGGGPGKNNKDDDEDISTNKYNNNNNSGSSSNNKVMSEAAVATFSCRLADVYYEMGELQYRRGKYSSALNFFKDSLQIRRQYSSFDQEYNSGIASCLARMGDIRLDISDAPMAMKYHWEALEIRVKRCNAFWVPLPSQFKEKNSNSSNGSANADNNNNNNSSGGGGGGGSGATAAKNRHPDFINVNRIPSVIGFEIFGNGATNREKLPTPKSTLRTFTRTSTAAGSITGHWDRFGMGLNANNIAMFQELRKHPAWLDVEALLKKEAEEEAAAGDEKGKKKTSSSSKGGDSNNSNSNKNDEYDADDDDCPLHAWPPTCSLSLFSNGEEDEDEWVRNQMCLVYLASSLRSVGEILLSVKKYADARLYFDAAMELMQKLVKDTEKEIAEKEQVRKKLEERHPEEQQESSRLSSARLLRQVGLEIQTAINFSSAEIHYHQGDFEAAIEDYKKILSLRCSSSSGGGGNNNNNREAMATPFDVFAASMASNNSIDAEIKATLFTPLSLLRLFPDLSPIEDDIYCAAVLRAFGDIFLSRGKTLDAYELHVEALAMEKRLMVKTGHRLNLDIALSYSRLADIMHHEDVDLNRIIVFRKRALKHFDLAYDSSQGDPHANIARGFISLGVSYNRMEKFQEAVDAFDRALPIEKALGGGRTPIVGDSTPETTSGGKTTTTASPQTKTSEANKSSPFSFNKPVSGGSSSSSNGSNNINDTSSPLKARAPVKKGSSSYNDSLCNNVHDPAPVGDLLTLMADSLCRVGKTDVAGEYIAIARNIFAVCSADVENAMGRAEWEEIRRDSASKGFFVFNGAEAKPSPGSTPATTGGGAATATTASSTPTTTAAAPTNSPSFSADGSANTGGKRKVVSEPVSTAPFIPKTEEKKTVESQQPSAPFSFNAAAANAATSSSTSSKPTAEKPSTVPTPSPSSTSSKTTPPPSSSNPASNGTASAAAAAAAMAAAAAAATAAAAKNPISFRHSFPATFPSGPLSIETLDASLAVWKQIRPVVTGCAEDLHQARILLEIGNLHHDKGALEAAIEAYLESSRIALAVKQWRSSSSSSSTAKGKVTSSGWMSDNVSLQAIEIAADAQHAAADSYRRLNDTDHALKWYNSSLSLRKDRLSAPPASQQQQQQQQQQGAGKKGNSSIPPSDSPSLACAKAMMSIGLLHHDRNELEEAATVLNKAIKVFKDTPDAHVLTGRAMHALGEVLHDQGMFQQALQTENKAMKLLKRAHGTDEHEDIAYLYASLGDCLDSQDKVDKAYQQHEKAEKIWRRLKGGGSAEVALALSAMGDLLQEEGKLKKALQLHEQALTILENIHKSKIATSAAAAADPTAASSSHQHPHSNLHNHHHHHHHVVEHIIEELFLIAEIQEDLGNKTESEQRRESATKMKEELEEQLKKVQERSKQKEVGSGKL